MRCVLPHFSHLLGPYLEERWSDLSCWTPFFFWLHSDNLDGWNKAMGDFAIVDFCLFLDCPESVMEQRLLKRGETSGRSDDNADSIRKRFKTYVESTKPVIDTFEKQSKLKHVLAAAPVEEVRANVSKIFKAVQWQ
jgi:thymidylate kinase